MVSLAVYRRYVMHSVLHKCTNNTFKIRQMYYFLFIEYFQLYDPGLRYLNIFFFLHAAL